MWVRISGTRIGIGIYTDPSLSFEDNVELCVNAARKELQEKGVCAVGSYLPENFASVGEVEPVDNLP